MFLDCEVMRSDQDLPLPLSWMRTNQCSDLLEQYLTVSKLYYSAHLLQASNNTGKGLDRVVQGGRDGFDGCWYPNTAFPGFALPWAQQQLPGGEASPRNGDWDLSS